MNSPRLLAALALTLVGASTVYAQSSEADLQHFGADQAPAASRADVRADVLKAQADGTLFTPSEVLAAAVPGRSDSVVPATARADVQAQARVQARTNIYRDRARIGAGF